MQNLYCDLYHQYIFYQREKKQHQHCDLMNTYLNHPSNVCHLVKLNEGVSSIPNFQTFRKLLVNIISCFFVYHSRYHRIRFGFPVLLSKELSTDACPFFMSEVSRFMAVGKFRSGSGSVGKGRIFVEETWELWMDLLLSHPKSWQSFSWGGKTDWKCGKRPTDPNVRCSSSYMGEQKVRFWNTIWGTIGYPFQDFPDIA